MKIIEPSVTLIEEKNPFKKIEIAGRTCYKSEAAITDESAKKFFDRIASHNHTAMMEHATFVFVVNESVYDQCAQCKYLNCTRSFIQTDSEEYYFAHEFEQRYLVSGNLRAINECGIACLAQALEEIDPALNYSGGEVLVKGQVRLVDFEKDIPHKTRQEIAAHRYTTMRFITDRGVTHELVRHRPFSFAQESTRYVNYTKEQNGGGNIKFIKPADFELWDEETKSVFEGSLMFAEAAYRKMLIAGRTPQEARAVLPNAVKTEIVVTGNEAEWNHFFDLRSRGTTGAPHPDMKRVADVAMILYQEKYYE